MTRQRLAARAARLISLAAILDRGRRGSALGTAWTAWRDGEVVRAEALAQEALAARPAFDQAHHLLFLTSFVRGDYRTALGHYEAIGGGYLPAHELAETVVDAYVHLGALADALRFARGRGAAPAVTIRRLEAHLARPFDVRLAGVTTLPFADHPLTEYFPAFDVGINGRRLTAHIDTGGAFLYMGPARAASLGIETVRGGRERVHLDARRVGVWHGIAAELVLGGAVLRNVPVDVLPTLEGEHDVVIFGTNVLEPFRATVDYPAKRLVLSRRGDAPALAVHDALIPAADVRVPFHLWSDHFMFARGGIGARALTFFVDSGLVALHPDGRGGVRQASFTSSRRRFKQWGVSRDDLGRGFFESSAPLTLGPLRQDRPVFVVGAAGDTSFGGVRVDGLISHAFLKHYAWTIDFDAREYRFAGTGDGSA